MASELKELLTVSSRFKYFNLEALEFLRDSIKEKMEREKNTELGKKK